MNDTGSGSDARFRYLGAGLGEPQRGAGCSLFRSYMSSTTFHGSGDFQVNVNSDWSPGISIGYIDNRFLISGMFPWSSRNYDPKGYQANGPLPRYYNGSMMGLCIRGFSATELCGCAG